MKSCRHIYLAHSVKLYQIKNNVQRELAQDLFTGIPEKELMATLKEALNHENLSDLNFEDLSKLDQLAESFGGIENLRQFLEVLAVNQNNDSSNINENE